MAESDGKEWAVPLALTGLLVAAILLLFHNAVAAALIVWWVSPTFSHCFAVLPISAWLVWERRRALRQMCPSVWPLALWAAVPLALLAVVGYLVLVNESIQLAMIGLVQVVLLALLGPAVYRVIRFPALFLFFLVPTGGYLIGPLQSFTAGFIVVALGLCGIPVYAEGSIIQVPNGTFEVAEACAGLRFLIATVMIGVLFSHFMFRRWWKIAAFLVACIAVPIIGNALRALSIILLARITNNRLAVGADHLIYGWGFSVAIMALLLVVGSRFQDRRGVGPVAPVVVVARRPLGATLAVAGAAFLLIALAPAAEAWRMSRTLPPESGRFSLPAQLADWTVGPVPAGWQPAYDRPDRAIAASLVRADAMVATEIYFYARQSKGHDLIESTNRLAPDETWQITAARPVRTTVAAQTVRVTETVLASPAERRLVWSCFWIDRRFVTGGLQVKLHQLGAGLTGRPGAALVALSTPLTASVAEARENLAGAVTALGDIGTLLAEASGEAGAGQERLACAE